MRILIFEPDVASAMRMGAICRRTPGALRPVVLSDAARIRRLSGKPFDLVFCDLALPERSGLEVIRTLRARHGRRCPIIATTSSIIRWYHRRALRAGADAVWVKPVDPGRVGVLIRTVRAGWGGPAGRIRPRGRDRLSCR